ncbi:unnamed protein product [Lasius platythorax]|uniref:Uncharacterized protein n=1 Tax=Lasius platythorax TaxID=488582 RepID=A0AAV2NQI7_9HYME
MDERVARVKHSPDLGVASQEEKGRKVMGRGPTNDGLMDGRNGFSMSSWTLESISRFSDETIRTAIGFPSNGLDYADAVIHPRRE